MKCRWSGEVTGEEGVSEEMGAFGRDSHRLPAPRRRRSAPAGHRRKQGEDSRRIVDTAPALFEGGVSRAVAPADLAGNVVGRGAPRGHVQSAARPCFGAGPWSGLYVISPKKNQQWSAG